MQDLTNFLLLELLVNILIEELAEKTKGLDRGQPVLQILIGWVFLHELQELIPKAIRYFNCGYDRQTDASILEGVTILTVEHLEKSILDEASDLFGDTEP